ncbi:bifunctional alpha,alpha-trehalose-phosphate synthase (UDP-forming)/trehalose-phosphatase [Ravibacter arvi]|uniref:Bifunctional alpha,alpha-trehalose-phosphate synthase (UDP-forming)/trehalose-phosphatase n=1 Tax=Ravibacter arvi TaxID=2051041 RepID=A0ABP8M3R7_9BACT
MINNKGKLIIAAYRLPFKIVYQNNHRELFQNSGGLVSAVLSLSTQKNYPFSGNISWVGHSENTALELQELTHEAGPIDAIPVTIPAEINALYYEGFCNDLIWPLFHYFPSEANFDKTYFEAYQAANQLFADKIAEITEPGDTIWIHDYQLMGLPALLREKFPGNTIAFFFHIPFPSFEIFRLLPVSWRKYLIDGILGADLIGFHTNDYVRYFLGTVQRLYPQYEQRLHYLNLGNRLVEIDAFPISIDFNKFDDAYQQPEVVKIRTEIKQHIPHKIIFSVDRLDYSKGLLHRLIGYELFLENNPGWRGKVTFLMVVVPSRDTIGQYQQMKTETDMLVGKINARFGEINWQPVIYQYRSLPFEELAAMYSASDVALITPVRDGMNLVCKEYVASRHDNRGVLILSEMAGAAAELSEAILINPTDNDDTANAIQRALEMHPDEQEGRMKALRQRLRIYDIDTWTNDFFAQLSSLETEQERLKHTYLKGKTMRDIKEKYANAASRIIFLDFDGTLVPIERNPQEVRLSEDMAEILRRMVAGNTVVIVSGRDRRFLEREIGRLPVYIVAEHGALVRDIDTRLWTPVYDSMDDWKGAIRPIMDLFVARCPGAFVEEKETSLAWHFRVVADKQYAQRRANELSWQLHNFLHPELNLQIINGNKVIEVKKTHYNKGTAALSFLENKPYDFILAMGDDTTDEDMFEALPETAYTIKIGEDLSAARTHLPSQKDVLPFLKSLLASPGKL